MNPDALTKKYAVAVASVAVCFSFSIPQEASAQLPPTNMGKFVHKPGDNQYGSQAQKLRHPPAPVRPVSRPYSGGGGGGGASYRYRKTRPKPKPDISLQAIPADEPIAPQGFPPLPEAVDIPGVERTNGLTAINNSSSSSYRSSAPRSNPYLGSKQGYGHYRPGAFMPQKQSAPPMGGGGDMHQHYQHVPTQAAKTGVGYYKARSAPLPTRGDTFGAQDGSRRTGKGARQAPMTAGAGAGSGSPSLGQALKGLGREPKLEDRVYGNTASAPEAPTPIQINQASTQDLSLPDDDFKRRKPPSAGGRMLKRGLRRIGNRMGNVMNSMPISNFGGR